MGIGSAMSDTGQRPAEYFEAEAVARRAAVLKRMLATPPTPEMPSPSKKTKKQEPL